MGDKNISQNAKKCLETCSVACAMAFCPELNSNLAVSQSMFSLPSLKVTSRTNSCVAPELCAVAHQDFLSKSLLRIFDFRSLSHFFFFWWLSPKRSTLFAWTAKSMYRKWNKYSKYISPFCRSRPLLQVSKAKLVYSVLRLSWIRRQTLFFI